MYFRRRIVILSVAFFSLCLSSQAQVSHLVIGGTVVTPDRVLQKAWISIDGGWISSISEEQPPNGNGLVIDTNLIIFPGFIDLHNHPMYNAIPRWTPPETFNNRYEWRNLDEYKRVVGTPGSRLQAADESFCDVDEFAEVRALIGGTTSITGISGRFNRVPPVPDCLTGLVRNLDWSSQFYGAEVAHERIDNALGVTPGDMSAAREAVLKAKLENNELDLLLIHVAEGLSSDSESASEFATLKSRGFLDSAFAGKIAVIHGAALTARDFREMRQAQAGLIWSPRSNFELYGATTDVASAYREGVSIAIAPDWSPTGSANMLEELTFASQVNKEQLYGLFSDRQLFEMATSIPARIAKIDDKVGSLRAGLYADLFLLDGDNADPFASLAQSNPGDVKLVLIGGNPVYGADSLLARFGLKTESIEVCSLPMQLNADALPNGFFSDVSARLAKDLSPFSIDLAPVAECSIPGGHFPAQKPRIGAYRQ